jgi:hypothetical protein
VDLRVYSRVVWRFKWLVIAGLLVALVLATISYAKFDFSGGTPHLTPRGVVVWESSGLLNVTQSGFPDGSVTPGTDPNRFPLLATLYSQYISSDPVRRIIRRHTPTSGVGQVTASPLRGPGGDVLPFLTVTAAATSASTAERLAQVGIDALRSYIDQEQAASRVVGGNRVVLQELRRPSSATILSGRSKVRPIGVFVIVLLFVLATAFVLENVRPRLRSLERADDHEQPASRRSA